MLSPNYIFTQEDVLTYITDVNGVNTTRDFPPLSRDFKISRKGKGGKGASLMTLFGNLVAGLTGLALSGCMIKSKVHKLTIRQSFIYEHKFKELKKVQRFKGLDNLTEYGGKFPTVVIEMGLGDTVYIGLPVENQIDMITKYKGTLRLDTDPMDIEEALIYLARTHKVSYDLYKSLWKACISSVRYFTCKLESPLILHNDYFKLIFNKNVQKDNNTLNITTFRKKQRFYKYAKRCRIKQQIVSKN